MLNILLSIKKISKYKSLIENDIEKYEECEKIGAHCIEIISQIEWESEREKKKQSVSN